MTRTRPPLRVPPQPGRPSVEEMQQRYAALGVEGGGILRTIPARVIDEARRLREAGGTILSIARETGLGHETVAELVRGVGENLQGRHRLRPVEDDRGRWYPSVGAAADAMGVSKSAVSNAIAGRQEHAGGRRWRYAK